MAQKFKFKLDALLKVREFKEQKIKIELGQLLKEISSVEEKIALAHKAIDECYEAQDAILRDPTSGSMLQFFPYFVKGKKEDIKNNENLLYALKKKYANKMTELAMARGEVKVMENFKEKKKDEWKKHKDKKEFENIEELIQMRKVGSGEL